MKISILTATFNREKYLLKLYESILNNLKTSKLEVEWIVIDDGSTDNTKQLFLNVFSSQLENNKELQKRFKIKYMYQQNSGKMAAINSGIQEATGELIIDCDSDDFFAEDALKKIENDAEKLFQNNNLYALCYLKQDNKGNISGKKFERNYLQTTLFDLYFKQEIDGEKILVFNAKIRKKYRHELEEGEKFVTEARMYHKMDEKYSILCINEVIEIGEYREDGYTKNIQQTFKKYPKGYYMYFKEILQKDLKGVTLKKKMYVIKQFIFFYILGNHLKLLK